MQDCWKIIYPSVVFFHPDEAVLDPGSRKTVLSEQFLKDR
jgi:hypothetical protein